MPANQTNHAQIAQRGEELYESGIRALVEPARSGEFVVIDVDTGDYEVDPSEVVAVRRMMARRPEGPRYIKRIGYVAAHRLGGRFGVYKQ